MMLRPDFEGFKALSAGNRVVPVCRELYADICTPIEVLRKIKNLSSRYFLLESVEGGEKWGRYSFLGFDPIVEIKCRKGKMTIKNGTTLQLDTEDPARMIRQILSDYKSPVIDGFPPFTGGFVGYFGYNYIQYTEKALRLKDEQGACDLDLMLFDKVIALDHFRQKICIIANAKTEQPEQSYNKAASDIDSIVRMIRSDVAEPDRPSSLKTAFSQAVTREQYCEMVARAKEYIFDGDIFQVVLSNRFSAELEGDLFDTYRVLRTINPSPYMFNIKLGSAEIAGSSPETMIRLTGDALYSFPIAGTRKRGGSEGEDALLEEQLLADEKELAEHNMLVDLARNDVGKISRFGSVKVREYLKVKRYSHVMHITSTVTGTIKEGRDRLDAVNAALPAGTLSGAPKIRACEIIDELEPLGRGIYGGAVGYIDFAGNMDTCIAIRMAALTDGRVTVQAGAGIVADSVPESEYEECKSKAKAVISALEAASGGIDL